MAIWVWVGFIALVIFFLALDLGVFHRNKHEVKTREALIWTGIWISISLLFNVLIYFLYENHWLDVGLSVGESMDGKTAALKFLTGYLLEKSLSLDNIFVIALIFSYFKIPPKYQHEVLFWGILGALVMRGLLIGVGVVLITTLSWITYVFGAFLIYSAFKMYFSQEKSFDPEDNKFTKLVKRFFPLSKGYEQGQFFTRLPNGKRAITPLFLVLLVIEGTDLMFALDSIPAILAITTDAFLVFTSNIFAILGLRSLYFALAAILDKFRFLKLSLLFLLGFVGVKMILAHHYEIPVFVSLGVIAGILGGGILASILVKPKEKTPPEEPKEFTPKEDKKEAEEGITS